jgi:hypothetical protein
MLLPIWIAIKEPLVLHFHLYPNKQVKLAKILRRVRLVKTVLQLLAARG